MTKEQCANCASPTKHCQDPKFKNLERVKCWNYTPKQPDHTGAALTSWERAGVSRSEYVRRALTKADES